MSFERSKSVTSGKEVPERTLEPSSKGLENKDKMSIHVTG